MAASKKKVMNPRTPATKAGDLGHESIPEPTPKPAPRPSVDGDWMARAQAARFLKVSLSTLKRWTQQGELHPRQSESGVWLYSRAELDEQVLPEESVQTTAVDALAATTEAMRASGERASRAYEIALNAIEPARSLAETNKEIIADLRARVRELESECAKNWRLVAETESRSESAKAREESRRRWSEALAAVKSYAPLVPLILGVKLPPSAQQAIVQMLGISTIRPSGPENTDSSDAAEANDGSSLLKQIEDATPEAAQRFFLRHLPDAFWLALQKSGWLSSEQLAAASAMRALLQSEPEPPTPEK